MKPVRTPVPPYFLLLSTLTLVLTGAAVDLAQVAPAARVAGVPVETLQLANGVEILLVPRPEATMVSAGWMVRCGSADDPPHHTGMSHLLEHLLFKGTRNVGTRQPDREAELLAEIDRLWAAERELELAHARAEPARRARLERQLEDTRQRRDLVRQQATDLQFLGEFSYRYSQQGGTGLNANTYRDMTVYYVTLPSEKLELWFWLESNRLLEPVFRQFFKEIGVIREERRLRIESNPTGALEEELRERFWGEKHPYAWNPMGRSDDLDDISRAAAYDFLSSCYRPDRMTLALVGGFDRAAVVDWAERYFDRLPPATTAALPAATVPVTAGGGEPFTGSCDCPSQVRVLYPSAAFGDADTYPLQLLAALLNGRSGRLYRDLVLVRGIAFSAHAQQISWRRAGEFVFEAESKGEFDPAAIVEAWDSQVARLRTGSVPADELDRAKNRLAGDAFRQLKDPAALMKQLLIYQGLGDWRYVNRWAGEVSRVGAADLERIVERYLDPASRTVAIFHGPASAAAVDSGPRSASEDTP